jgi:hypothetical protein
MSKKQATRKQIINDIKRVAKEFPDTTVITRDFFRQHSLFSEVECRRHFGAHADLISAAGLKPSPVVVEAKQVSPADKLLFEQQKLAAKTDDSKKLLAEAVKKITLLEQEKSAIIDLTERTPQIFDIETKGSSGSSESVAVLVASDWHSEEEVLPGQVGGLNEHNLEIGHERALRFWQGGQRLWDIFRRDTKIKTIIVGLIGDFITNSIHEDGAESNLLAPSDAIYRVQNMLLSGLRFLLDNTDANLVVVCHGGNHGRTTPEQRIATETGNSLEQYMYYNLRDLLEGEPRIKFQIAEGYHSYTRLFDGKYVIRWHHGHGMNYGGGVGGIYIPVQKAINQWNKGTRADLDVFGHFHTSVDANNFVANGSLIGYNAYALRIKADYERPKQSFFLVNRKWNSKSIFTPIFV